tara:strand:+ start:1085 stop:1408 length:324 start_codon:yes stop_codon:yes gene_type:complete
VRIGLREAELLQFTFSLTAIEGGNEDSFDLATLAGGYARSQAERLVQQGPQVDHFAEAGINFRGLDPEFGDFFVALSPAEQRPHSRLPNLPLQDRIGPAVWQQAGAA